MKYYSKLLLKIVFLTIVIIVVVQAVKQQQQPPAPTSTEVKPVMGIQSIDTNGLLEAMKLPQSLFLDTRTASELRETPKIPRAIVVGQTDWADLIERGKSSVIIIAYGKRDSLYNTMEIADRLSKEGGFPVYYYVDGIDGWADIINNIKKAYD